ncbi:MAG: DUF1501 domain-containing protein [Planctomycetes bacterium]|nr:DUF1501 domain-containing protein [Planctomycetota bacterium]
MNFPLRHELNLAVNRDGVIGRRDFLRGISAAGLAMGSLGWVDQMSLQADELRRKGKACILLWMQGGPSQLETFDPKPGHANGGETKAIDTSVSGIQISENLPKLAASMKDLAIIRSMTTKEGNHQRASFLLHTSYVPTASVNYPTMGSIVTQQLPSAGQLPSFVRIGSRFPNCGDGGFLGNEHNAFVVNKPDRKPDNVTPATDNDRYVRRLGLMNQLDAASHGDPQLIAQHQKLYKQTSTMVLSPQMKTFDVSQEKDTVRDAYGRSDFGTACLLARRLVESGVTFVEIGMGNWDTHDDNFKRSKTLCEQMDQPFAHLLQDLRQRGLLSNTLVVWMGEFGRTPRINARGGRDHFPRAFNAVLAGGGIHGGQVIGSTDAGGESVTDAPVTEKDLFQSIYKSLKIDAAHEFMSPIGRPIKVVDGGHPVDKLFG